MCLATFPFPDMTNKKELAKAGTEFYECRLTALKELQVGLTKFGHKLNSKSESLSSVEALRAKLIAMDRAVLDAYDWSDIETNHDFHEVEYLPEGKNVRFTFSEKARTEIMNRLIERNHLVSLAEKKNSPAPTTRRGKSTAAAGLLFDDEG